MRTSRSSVRRNVELRGWRNFAACAASCAVVGLSMLLHAWVRTAVTERGYALSRLSAEYRELVRENEGLRIRAAELKSPQRIEDLARTRLHMGPPAVDRVVVLVRGAPRPSLLTASR